MTRASIIEGNGLLEVRQLRGEAGLLLVDRLAGRLEVARDHLLVVACAHGRDEHGDRLGLRLQREVQGAFR